VFKKLKQKRQNKIFSLHLEKYTKAQNVLKLLAK
jgi:hypothetical protein